MSASDIVQALEGMVLTFDARGYAYEARKCREAAAEITRLRADITGLEDGNMTFLCDQLDKAKAENVRLRSLVEEAGTVVGEIAFWGDFAKKHAAEDDFDRGSRAARLEAAEIVADLLPKLKGEGQ